MGAYAYVIIWLAVETVARVLGRCCQELYAVLFNTVHIAGEIEDESNRVDRRYGDVVFCVGYGTNLGFTRSRRLSLSASRAV